MASPHLAGTGEGAGEGDRGPLRAAFGGLTTRGRSFLAAGGAVGGLVVARRYRDRRRRRANAPEAVSPERRRQLEPRTAG